MEVLNGNLKGTGENSDLNKKISEIQKVVDAHIRGDIPLAKRGYHSLINAGLSNAIVCTNLSTIYSQEQDHETTQNLLREAIQHDPEYFDAHLKLGCSIELRDQGKLDEAIQCYQKVIEIKPDHAQGHFSLGSALFKKGLTKEAIECYEKTVAYQPEHLVAQFNLGNLYIVNDQLIEAIECFKKVLKLDDSMGGALCKYWHMRMKVCDWNGYKKMHASLKQSVYKILDKKNKPDVINTISPFSLLNIYDDPALHLRTAEKYTKATASIDRSLKPLFSDKGRNKNGKIKIAFLSADLYDHATAFLMAELFELLDTDQFEIHALSFGQTKKDSVMRKRIEKACGYFHDVADRSDYEIAQLIAIHEIDIAIDLKGYTSESRPAILAYRPSPIQVNYLGFPGSMGAPFIDYIIADEFVIPEEEKENYSEKIMYMPDTYQVNDRKRAVSSDQPTRQACGLPESGFVFCCFNHSYKITPEVFDVWMNLLKETSDSVLWLLDSNPQAVDNLQKEAQARGVDPDRLIFAEQLTIEHHLSRIKNADLFLDTFPCNAHTTASDALWVGLPVLTYSGRGFASRVAGSLLKAMGADELIAANLNDYFTQALQLANNQNKINAIKNKLKNNRDTCPLFDTERYKNSLQRGFKHMMGLREARREAEDFFVPEDNTKNTETYIEPLDDESSNVDQKLIVNITIIRPENYPHSDAFKEVSESLFFAFNDLGFDARSTENVLISDGINIILGANLLTEEDINLIPNSSIIYNFEQITDDSTWMTPAFINLFKQFQVWDYSKKNIEALKHKGVQVNIHHVPVGYTPNLTRIPKAAKQDIDVLFYGSMNPRRQEILDGLTKEGLKVESLFNVYGADRDEYISRSKVILNIHFYDSNIFEQVRVSYLLANKKAVVCECASTTEVDDDMKEAVALVPYDQLISKCVELVKSEDLRNQQESLGFNSFIARNAVDYVSDALAALGSKESQEPEVIIPTSINIGSGKDFKENCLNIDICAHSNPDVVADLSDPAFIGQIKNSARFGDISFAQNQFDEIIANDVLEHIPELIDAMTNCLHLLKVGGQFKINVPYDLSYGAWQDPTHVRAFNERSWLYYTDWYWYLNWTEARFDLTKLDFTLSPSGQKLQQLGKSTDEILTQPRAVDSMSVILTKRLLTEEEKAVGTQRMAGA